MSIPYLIYYKDKNPDYGKTYTMDVSEDNEELWGCLLGDAMTLGRYLPPYEEWNPSFRQRSLEALIKGATYEWTIVKQCVHEDEPQYKLETILKRLDPSVNSFFDKDLQAKFVKLHEGKE